jgi:8-oxo-dGTP diphosphatase
LSFVVSRLSNVLRPVSDEQGANASVAVLLKLDGGKLRVLFVRRVRNSRDPWSGQMALPGGKREAKDRNLKETVIRETLEETNISLLENCRFLGAMSAFQSKPRPETRVLPFVVLVEDEQSIRLNENELEEYFWVSVEELVRNRTRVGLGFGESPAFVLGNMVIWGLTFRIIERLVYLMETRTTLRDDDSKQR